VRRTRRSDPAPWSPHGQALLDYFHGEHSAQVVVHEEGGESEVVPVRVFFRGPSEFSALEEAALDLCRGRVLDAGAGTGCHALVLQELGLSVCAVDIAPEAVEIMRCRGVRDARRADLFQFRGGPFDTILMMMNGIGVVGTLAGLDRFLGEVPRLLAPGGRLLCDSYDPRPQVEASAGSGRPGTGQGPPRRYPGEMRFQLEYQGRRGPTLAWLFLDPETLSRHAEGAGWRCEVIWREEEGHYLARLTRLEGMIIDGWARPGEHVEGCAMPCDTADGAPVKGRQQVGYAMTGPRGGHGRSLRAFADGH
jgi:SAM-dependent methyltransferase